MNLRNFGQVEGRLVRDPKVFENKDGSKKIIVTLAVNNNFKSRDGEVHTQFPSLEAYLSGGKEGNGPYDYMKKGDLVGFGYSIRTGSYEKDGETIYTQTLLIEDVDLKETKKSKAQRETEATLKENQAVQEEDANF